MRGTTPASNEEAFERKNGAPDTGAPFVSVPSMFDSLDLFTT